MIMQEETRQKVFRLRWDRDIENLIRRWIWETYSVHIPEDAATRVIDKNGAMVNPNFIRWKAAVDTEKTLYDRHST